MIKNILKIILPKSVITFLAKYKNEAKQRKDKEVEEVSEDFINRKNFYAQFLKKGDTYFDIGANYGNRISPIMKLEVGLIVPVEHQSCCNYLRETFKGIIVLQNGVGAIAETKTLNVSSDSVLS